jgi:beta-carotene hydroxylase
MTVSSDIFLLNTLLKHTFKDRPMALTETPQPDWTRRAERAVPKLDVPSLRSIKNAPAVDERRLRALLILRPFVGLATFAAMAFTGWWLAAPVVLWLLYGSTATALHHLIHGSLGLSPAARHRWLTVLGLLILESGHAWQTTHVMHHRDGSDLPDPEGYIEYLTWRQLPVGAFQWRFRIAAWGWRHTTQRRRTTAELAINATATVAAVALVPVTTVPLIYVAMMQLGTFLFAVLLAKGPQTNFGRATTTPLMMVHTRLLGIFLFNHHLHLEHHAYPKVPMARLRQLRPTVEAALTDEHVVHVHLAA